MRAKFCSECGTALIDKPLEGEGIAPFCPQCEQHRFPLYNVAASMTVSHMRFNRTKFFEPSNTLMCNFTAFVPNDRELHVNGEIDRYQWFDPD